MIRKDAERGGESGFAIYVNGSHPRVRRRFSIAHEIAHFALHRNLIGDGVTDDAMYRSNLSSAVEVQANRMAADILMPWHLIREATDKGIDTVERLAEYFDVSRSTMRSEEHTSALQSLIRLSYAVFCLKKQTSNTQQSIR